MIYVLIAIAVLAILFTSAGIRIVQQSETVIIERLGKYSKTLQAGINIIIPIIDRPRDIMWRFTKEGYDGRSYIVKRSVNKIDLRETVYDFPKQNVITKDNVVTEINAILYFQVIDPVKAVYEISNLPDAIEKLTQTTLRNVIGDMNLDETLTSRDTINSKLRNVLDDASHKWGVKVNRVELQDINPPHDIRDAMEKQMRAEREKRATIAESEGERQARINQAEGKKKEAIQISEGEREKLINIAEGQAREILMIAEATAEGIAKIATALSANGGEMAANLRVAEKYIEEFGKLAKENNTMIIPSTMSDVSGLIATAMSTIKHTNQKA